MSGFFYAFSFYSKLFLFVLSGRMISWRSCPEALPRVKLIWAFSPFSPRLGANLTQWQALSDYETEALLAL